MPYRQEQFVNEEIYHITMRRIEDNLLFKEINDYYRGIFSIYEFNTTRPVTIRERRQARFRIKQNRDPVSMIDGRDPLVEVLVFCLMPNHIHLLLRQLKDGGITKYMNKIGAGYPAYFRQKYNLDNKGYFFQGRFAAVRIKTEEQLKVVFAYIHINPVSLVEPGWKEMGIKNPEKVIEFLENYKWSSYPDYIGKSNFPSVTERKFITDTMGGEQRRKEFVDYWVRYKGKIKEFPELALE